MKMLPCLVSFCVHNCNFSFNPSFSCHNSEIVDFWYTCPAWIAFVGVLVKRLVFLCRYCYLFVTYWASWRLVNCWNSLHEMGRFFLNFRLVYSSTYCMRHIWNSFSDLNCINQACVISDKWCGSGWELKVVGSST
jgi:hypothetical protein